MGDVLLADAAGLGVIKYAPKAAIETTALWRRVHTRLANGSNNGKASPFNSPRPAA
jgi:hypothetical protein